MSEPRHAPPTMGHAAPLVVVVPANVSGDDSNGSAVVPCTEDSGSVEVTVGSGLVATIDRDQRIDRDPEYAVALPIVGGDRGDASAASADRDLRAKAKEETLAAPPVRGPGVWEHACLLVVRSFTQ